MGEINTLPETNIKTPLKIVGIRFISFLGPAYFQGRTVSFREGVSFEKIENKYETKGCNPKIGVLVCFVFSLFLSEFFSSYSH